MYFKVFQDVVWIGIEEVTKAVPALSRCHARGMGIIAEKEFCQMIPAPYRQEMLAFQFGAEATPGARFKLLDAMDESKGFLFEQDDLLFIVQWQESGQLWIMYLMGVPAPAGWEDGAKTAAECRQEE
ncbi:MAG: hypothetical protein A3I91_04580 [Candidatus Kerfeldbacteria bacterium RIFCSPLOWO2_02_FULL_42_19]|nr:MAG: hypothetical protein A3E60_05055 [Candidatus Kerfeldbacteria bacterium RIFCSPHIGHO2_12_FULL_42_13]OGY83831.1 MAG: hypothetical protein A3I91_04580 [Candidatus Kerfeldbacteria bacterium RIFCSPLOWO2_02_FULL_42_19]